MARTISRTDQGSGLAELDRAVLVDQHQREAARPQLLAHFGRVGGVGVGQDHHVALDQLAGILGEVAQLA